MNTSEQAIEMHKKWNGKLETIAKTPVKTRRGFSYRIYTGCCGALQNHRSK